MVKIKTREITIIESKGAFSIFGKDKTKKGYDFEGISALRKIISNEKARMLYIIKTENPLSIYDLAKKLGRTFKSVSDDVKLLERFGFIELIKENTGERARLKPVISVDTLTIHLKI